MYIIGGYFCNITINECFSYVNNIARTKRCVNIN